MFNNPAFGQFIKQLFGEVYMKLEEVPMDFKADSNILFGGNVEEKPFETPYENMPEKGIDRVTVDMLDMALRLVDIRLDKELLKKIIDVIGLLEVKGGETRMNEVIELAETWKPSPSR